MLDKLQLEGLLARYTLRHWTDHVGAQHQRRIRYHDEDEAQAMLARLLDADSLRRLRSFLWYLGVEVHVCGAESASLLVQVAKRIVSGELVLEREPIMPMASDEFERLDPVHFEPIVNEIYDGVGLKVLSPLETQQPIDPTILAQQARQAKALHTSEPFCEVCSNAHTLDAPGQGAIDSQAQQAKALKTASATGAPFCELCAACGGPKDAHAPPQAELASQGMQTKALQSAAATGTPFCERCSC
jgi:hypothetical protein